MHVIQIPWAEIVPSGLILEEHCKREEFKEVDFDIFKPGYFRMCFCIKSSPI